MVIPILFENSDVIAVDKPEGLAAIPERRRQGQSLLDMLSAERGEKLYVVHRLDKETRHHRLRQERQDASLAKSSVRNPGGRQDVLGVDPRHFCQ